MNIEKITKIVIIFIIFLLILNYGVRIINEIITSETAQWDFRVYYWAGKLYNKINPYKDVSKITSYPFVYPPFTLPLFSLIFKIPFDIIFYLWFFFKCVLLTLLIFIWRRKFINTQTNWTFYILCILGFDRTIFIDLISGNISIIEQFFIWLGFYFYLRRKYFLFCIFIIVASICKITPILFLFLLLLTKEKNKWKYFFLSIIPYIGIFGISYLIDPILFKDFVYMLQYLSRYGSRIGLILDSIKTPNYYGIIYFILTATVIFITYRAYVTLNSIKIEDKEKIILFLFCVVYLLVIPRPLKYSFILIIVPTFFILKKLTPSYIKYIFLISTSLSSYRIAHILQLQEAERLLLIKNFNLIFSYVVWVLYLLYLYKFKKGNENKIGNRYLCC